MFFSLITDILDIKEKDLLFINENVNFPIKPTALFMPKQQEKLAEETASELSKKGVELGKRYAPKKRIELVSTIKHRRSAVLPILIKFSDKYDNKYGWINFKGIGNWLEGGGFVKYPNKLAPFCDEFGHLGYIFAKRDQELSDKLIALGFRTSVVLFIIRLREIPGKDGRMHPMEEFLEHYKLPIGSTPVVMARGMRNYLRIEDFMIANLATKKVILTSAILDVRNRDKDKSVKDKMTFAVWFAETIAKQLSILYSVRAYHSYITPHNITLAAEIVDLDSLSSNVLMDIDKEAAPDQMFKDVEGGWKCTGHLMASIGLEKKEIYKLLLRHYLFKYLEYVAEIKFKANHSKREAVKGELTRALARFVNKDQPQIFDKGHEKEQMHVLDEIQRIFISVDRGAPITFG